ncbi:MAG TPA: HAD-IB family phosphatase [Candidatus Saccharimonadales bacterium]|nr:HAD-IB family phosphatase [Candidatus Saccharimonadales bacterium]
MKVAFFDIDGTIVAPFTAGLYLSFLSEQGKFRKESIKIFFRETDEYVSKKKTYEQLAACWGKELGEGLKGYTKKDVELVTEAFWRVVKPRIAPWAKKVIELFNNNGYTTIAISGSTIELLNLYQKKLGLQQIFASTAEVINGMYTGNILLNLVLQEEKEMIVNEIIKNESVNLENSFGFGDNEHDRAFLDKIGNPVCIISESNLRQYAEEKGWRIFNFNDDVYSNIKNSIVE